MKKSLFYSLLTIVSLLFLGHVASAQVTTASLHGTILDEKKEAVPGATVVALHTPTGAKYGTVTDINGIYNINGMKAGGPYTITVTFVGYEGLEQNNLTLSLGQRMKLDYTLKEGAQELKEVEIVAKFEIIDESRTGAATNVNKEQLESMPTLSRGLGDFARLTPQFSATEDGGLSFGGQNNRFNSVMIDGAVNNDVFGLNANGSPGGRTGSQPISLDAIQELQVLIAPFDVRQSGFTGAGMNAITRSGTNKVEGSVYYFTQSQKLAGKSISTVANPDRVVMNEFIQNQAGFRLGLPLIKNKLFLFVNGEYGVNNRPYSADLLYNKDSVALMTKILKEKYGYDIGDINKEVLDDSDNKKTFARLDWNISQKHKLVFRHNFVNAYSSDLFRNTGNFSVNNSQYKIQSITNGTVLELNSALRSDMANEFRIGYNRIRDSRNLRNPEAGDFPQFTVAGPVQNFLVGAGRFSALNTLSQDLLEITDNFTWFKGKHTITAGTRNEFYFFDNLFTESGYGEWTFNNPSDLAAGKATSFRKDYSLTDQYKQSAKWGALQLGLYAQDEWNMSKDFKLTIGLRGDLPLIVDQVAANKQFEQSFFLKNSVTPKANVLWSPRVGFNYNVKGKGSTQIRGGVGIFSGKAPFVWLSNQYSKNGVQFANARWDKAQIDKLTEGMTEAERIDLLKNPYYLPKSEKINQTVEIDISNPGLKLPQVARLNIGIDQKLPFDIMGTLEGMYSKTLNDLYVRDVNLAGVVGKSAQGRDLWGTAPNVPTMIDSKNFTNVYSLENTSKGFQYNFTVKLERNKNNIFSTLAYTRGVSKDIKSGSNSIAAGNWAGTPVTQSANDPSLAFSNFDLPHRVVGALGYNFNYAKRFSTQFSLFYSGQAGRRYSYVYNGDANFDAFDTRTLNDLIYVPKDSKDIIFSGTEAQKAAQWTAFDAFIENDKHLKSRRGQFAERNGNTGPWTHSFDLRVTQNAGAMLGKKAHKLQFTLDIFNIGNMFNQKWGVSYSYFANGNTPILNLDGIDPTTKNPIVTFNPAFEAVRVNRFIPSVWRMQIGGRYTF